AAVSIRKQWIALHSPVRGTITVDSGAAEAILEKSRSLLLAGVREVSGKFAEGEVIEVYCDGSLIGRGVSRYGADQLLASLSPSNLTRRSGTVIHRDEWAPTR
ncbi:glutamate 5-kinase, partial [Mesorhizobium sp. M00.F.Ca.ET.186.01.1.1]